MKKIMLIGVGIFIGYCLFSRNKPDSVQNTNLMLKMITNGASVEELKIVSDLIRKYCSDN